MKKGKIAIIIVLAGIVIVGGSIFGYKKVKDIRANKAIEKSVTFMKEGNFKDAKNEIDVAKKFNANNKNIAKEEEVLNVNIKADKTYSEALDLSNKKEYGEAIIKLNEIDSSAKIVKEKADKLKENIEKSMISANVTNASKNINKNNFDGANKEIEAIKKIDPNSKEIAKLNEMIESKKNSIKEGYVKSAKEAILNKNISAAKSAVSKLTAFDKNSKDIKPLNESIQKLVGAEKFSTNEYIGLGNETTISYNMSPYIGRVKIITSYYNPDVITNKSFVDFYYARIKPNRRQNVIYDLVNINNTSEGFTFAGAANENEEFNKGRITQGGPNRGTIDIDDPNAQYCGIHGYNIVSFMLNGKNAQGKVPFKFN